MAKRKGKTTVMDIIADKFKRERDYSNQEITSVWFTTVKGQLIGIVSKKDPYGKVRTYIGVGNGTDKHEDEANILIYGAPFEKGMLP